MSLPTLPTEPAAADARPRESVPAEQPPAEPDAGVEDLSGVVGVTPAHPELLEVDEPSEAEPAHPELLEDSSPEAASPSAPPRAPAAGAAKATAERPADPGRACRHVRRRLREAETSEAVREVLERGRAVGLTGDELGEQVELVAAERVRGAKGNAAQASAREWGRQARVACTQAVARAAPAETVQAEPVGPPAGAPATSPAAPAEPPKVLRRGVAIERYDEAAAPWVFILGCLAELTAGTTFDLTKVRSQVIYKGTDNEREIPGDPLGRAVGLLADRKVQAQVAAGSSEPEDPTWELVALGVAVVAALAEKGRPVERVKQLVGTWKKGSVGAARGVQLVIGKLKRRGK